MKYKKIIDWLFPFVNSEDVEESEKPFLRGFLGGAVMSAATVAVVFYVYKAFWS